KRLKPDTWRVRDLIASAYSDWGDWNSAIREHRESVRKWPSVPFTHTALGDCLLAVGNIEEAVEAFRGAIRVDPQDLPASVGLGRALFSKGEFSAAREAVRRAHGRMPPWERIHDPESIARKSERMISLEARLPAVLCGKDRPASGEESAEFAQLCE